MMRGADLVERHLEMWQIPSPILVTTSQAQGTRLLYTLTRCSNFPTKDSAYDTKDSVCDSIAEAVPLGYPDAVSVRGNGVRPCDLHVSRNQGCRCCSLQKDHVLCDFSANPNWLASA
jgi:hypothetical protein